VGLTNSTPAGRGWTIETQAGVIANHITADYGIRYMGLKWKVGAAVGTDTGINVFVDTEGKVSGVSRLGVVVSAELGGGVSMRFK
jgi:DnaJ family protein C protein 11